MKSGSKTSSNSGRSNRGKYRSQSGRKVIEMPDGSGGSFWGLAKALDSSRIDRECGGRLLKGSRRFLAMFRFDGGRKTWVNNGQPETHSILFDDNPTCHKSNERTRLPIFLRSTHERSTPRCRGAEPPTIKRQTNWAYSLGNGLSK